MSNVKVFAHDVEGLTYTEWNVATPFRHLADGSYELREQAAAVVELVGSLDEAEVACLPSDWCGYDSDTRPDAVAFIERAAAAGKSVGVWVFGDDEYDLPWSNVIQFQHAFRRSRPARTTRRVLPSMFADLAGPVYDGRLAVLPKGDAPLVGFCGQAGSSPVEETKRAIHKARMRALRLARRTDAVPEPWPSHVRMRRRLLDALATDDRIHTRFLLRDQYRGGLTGWRNINDPLPTARQEYYDNIHDTQYTLCVRGGGNFSLRLYETLCLGRIPLVVDADGILPWPDDPFWHEVALVVPVADAGSLGDRLLAHHARAGEAEWADRQARARAFWVDRLSRPGWLAHLPELLTPAGPA